MAGQHRRNQSGIVELADLPTVQSHVDQVKGRRMKTRNYFWVIIVYMVVFGLGFSANTVAQSVIISEVSSDNELLDDGS